MANFQDLLDKDPSTFERPPTLPEGEYLCLIREKTFGESSKKKTPYVEFKFGVLSALPSVPSEALESIDLTKAKLKDEFYITDDAMYRLREFFDTIGVTAERTRDAIEASIGQQVVITVGHQQSTNPNTPGAVFAVVRGYAKAE